MYRNYAAKQVLDSSNWNVNNIVPESWRLVAGDALGLGKKIEFEEKMSERIFLFVVSPLTSYVNVYGHD